MKRLLGIEQWIGDGLMIGKLRSLFSSNKGIPSPQDKAKAVYWVLISHGKIVIQDILNSAPDEFKHSRDFEAFLANEIGVIMCLNSTREGYERFFADRQERELFTVTLASLFKHDLHISWDVFEQYINLGEKSEEPDKIIIQLFTARIIAFLNREEDLYTTNGEKILLTYWTYSFWPEIIIYSEFYPKILTIPFHAFGSCSCGFLVYPP